MSNKQKNNDDIQNQDQEITLCNNNSGCNCENAYDGGFFYPFWDDLFWDRPFRKELSNLQAIMRTDIQEIENGYEFKVEVPGFERKDLNIGFENGYLTITVNKVGNGKQNANRYLRRERVTSACSRSFYVGDIDQTQISASLSDGVLTVVVPKEIKRQRHQIEVK